MLKDDAPDSVVPYVAELLDDAGIRVLFWNGDRDLLCCHTGTDMLLDGMKWSGAKKWKTVDRGVWMVNDRFAGYTKTLGNLTYVTVYNSGHMVYYNQPVRCLDLVKRQLKGESFFDKELPYYPRDGSDPKDFCETVAFKAMIGLLIGVVSFLTWHFLIKRNSRGDYDEVKEEGNGGHRSYRD